MGLDKYKKTPCGFCFIEYYNREDAENCLRYINIILQKFKYNDDKFIEKLMKKLELGQIQLYILM